MLDDQAVEKRINLAALARKLFHESGNEIDPATDHLMMMAEKDPELHNQIYRDAMRQAAREVIRRAAQEARRALWQRSLPAQARESTTQVEALARSNAQGLLDFTLPYGGRLGDATKYEIVTAAKWYREQSKDMGWKARWLDRISERLTDQTTRVGEIFDPDQLARIQSETQEDA